MSRLFPASDRCGMVTAGLALALPLIFGSPALATTEHWLTTLSLEELARIEVGANETLARTRPRDTVAAIRAGCADGHDVCDALRAVLATSKPNEDTRREVTARPQYASATARATAEPQRPRPDPSMIAGPGHAAFGGADTVEAAVRALGFGVR